MRIPLLSLMLFSLLLSGACSDDTTPKDSGGSDLTVDSGPPASCGTSAYLPADSAVGDFKQGTVKAADTGKRLDDLIDGGSEKYKTNNFKCMVQVVYTSGTKSYEIKVWLFDQTDATGASGAYTASGGGGFTDITPTVGDASREDLTLPLDYLADMRKGQYLARVQIDDNSGKDDGRAMIKAIASKLP